MALDDIELAFQMGYPDGGALGECLGVWMCFGVYGFFMCLSILTHKLYDCCLIVRSQTLHSSCTTERQSAWCPSEEWRRWIFIFWKYSNLTKYLPGWGSLQACTGVPGEGKEDTWGEEDEDTEGNYAGNSVLWQFFEAITLNGQMEIYQYKYIQYHQYSWIKINTFSILISSKTLLPTWGTRHLWISILSMIWLPASAVAPAFT